MLQRRFVFGVRTEVKDGLQYMDDQTCCWVAGKQIVVYNTQYATQRFLPCSETCEGISAMMVSPNRRVLAVAEVSDTPSIVIYAYDPSLPNKFRRKRTLQTPEVGSREFVSIGFSADGRYLATQGGFPEWQLVLWNVDKGKAIGVAPVVDRTAPVQDRRLITQCSISPKDPHLLCVSGNGVFKFFRYSESQLRHAPGGIKGDPMSYLAHVWLPPDDRLIVSTDNGDLLLVENGEYKYPLPLSPSDGLSIDSLIAYSKGFICGGDMGLVTIFERSEDKELYRKMRTLKVEGEKKETDGIGGDDAIKVLSFSLTPPPAEEYLAMMTSNKQIYVLNLSNADFNKTDDHVGEPLSQRYHAGCVTGLDICVRKPLLVTCGKDRSIYLWNYMTNTIEVSKHFATEVLSVAIHPTGLHLLVGFPDKLRFMNVYGDDIREFKSFGVRSCTECRFSNGGAFFAAMHSNAINVYFTYTCEPLDPLRAHNGKIKNIQFMPEDTRMLSVGVDGGAYEWDLTRFVKEKDHVIKAISYNAIAGDDVSVWCAGNDRKLRQLDRKHFAVQQEFDLKTTAIQCMVHSAALKLLFAGCDDGTVRVFNTFPVEKAMNEKAQLEKGGVDKDSAAGQGQGGIGGIQDILIDLHSGHSGAISRIAMTFDESLVATVGEDGVLQLWDVVAPNRSAKKEISFASEILIDKKELEERMRGIAELQAKVADLKQRAEQTQYKRELKHEEHIQALKDEFQEKKHKMAQTLDKFLSDKNEEAIKFTKSRQSMDEKHREDKEKIEQDYNAKIQALEEQSLKLKADMEENRAEFERQKNLLEATAAADFARDAAEYEQRLAQERALIRTLRSKQENSEADAEEVCFEIEQETDMEIMELKESYEKRMKQEQDQCSVLNGQCALSKQQEQRLKSEVDEKKRDIQQRAKEQNRDYVAIKGFEKDIKALEHELGERTETIIDKDKRIMDLRKKNQELEKFKFVLEYKIKELHSQIDPREEEIKQAHAKYAEMDAESERYLHNNDSLVLTIKGLKLKLDGQGKEIENLKSKLAVASEYQSRLWTELSDLYEETNPRKLKEMTKSLYYKHTMTGTAAKTEGGKLLSSKTTEDAQRDYTRERDYLERTVSGLKRKLIKDAETNRTDRSRIIGENVTLIKEINELRREVRNVRATKKAAGFIDPNAPRDDVGREVEIQKAEIVRLRSRLAELERQLHAAGKPVSMATPPAVM